MKPDNKPQNLLTNTFHDASVYPPGEDIYAKSLEVPFSETGEETTSSEDKPARFQLGDGLDVPGAADDDADEKIGSEDEENNYYSIGGELHDNLEEDQPENNNNI